ncbi:autotransporter outer membrane beta-barrel domain-containing protein [Chelativorans sp.]|uniref:autotransporter family protein n=1 Tax=Chelativorans sp. TaxID=2203393 RepID=UPI002811A396|nr:autotransporter outer membrane beta-barrel domain-containing protein [Chelativorans sp.]
MMSAGSDLGDVPLTNYSGTLAGIGTVGSVILYGPTVQAPEGAVIAPGVNGIGSLTIDGDFHSDRGVLQIQTELGGDTSPTDLLVITGGTSGSTNVDVINLGGTGAPTVEGIRIIQVGGASNGVFSLVSDYEFQGDPAVVAGAYAYRLYQGSTSDPADGDWYLRSVLEREPEPEPEPPLYQPGVPLYEAYAGALLGFIDIGSLQQRVGNRQWTVVAEGADAVSEETVAQRQLGIWAELRGFGGSFEPETSTTGADYDLSSWKFKAGIDIPVADLGAGDLIGGVSLHYGTFSADVASVHGNGSIEGSGYGAGGTLTWYADNGFYVDGQGQVTWFDSDLESSTAGLVLEDGNEGVGYALSLETGKRIALTPAWATTPQAQLTYSAVEFDDFTDAFGADVSLDRAENLVGRLGITLDRQAEWQGSGGSINRSHFYGIANLYYDFDGGSNVDVAGADIESEDDALWGGLGIGGSLNFADDKYSLYGEALAKTSLENFGDSHSITGTVGFRMQW